MRKFLVIVFVAAAVCKTTGGFAQVNMQDSLALVDLYNSTGGPNWFNKWDLNTPVSTWYGITIDTGRVSEINLLGNNLDGNIPSSFNNLGALVLLNLNSNLINSNFLSLLENLNSLQEIDLEDCELHDSLPSSLGNLPSLQRLDLEYNQIPGNIPSSFGNLLNLKYLLLDSNQITGNFPATFVNLKKLAAIAVANNKLSGSIPVWLDSLTLLDGLDISYNQFTGSIPSLGDLEFFNAYLDFSHNQLRGAVPDNIIFTLSQGGGYLYLDDNYFNFNDLDSPYITSFSSDPHFVYSPQANIPITYNAGIISVSAGGVPTNDTFHWYKNGVLYQTYIGDSTLALSGVGVYSVAVTNSVAIALTLYSDTFFEVVPRLLDSLALVDFYNSTGGPNWTNNTNWLTSAPMSTWYGISVVIDTTERVSAINLSNNNLTGIIPLSIGNLSQLVDIDLSNNNLKGTVPDTLITLQSLYVINIANNQFTDTIPANIVDYYFETLNFSSNKFTFESIEPIVAQGTVVSIDTLFYYSPQAPIPLNYNAGNFSVSAGGTLTNETFRLYRNDSLIATQVGDSVFTANASGVYWVAVTNSIATKLTLYSDSMVLGADSAILPAHPRIEYANRQFANANGWTDYYWDNNTPYDFTDDTLLLSLKTNGQNIGELGDGTFAVKLVATADAGSGMAIKLTNPLITNPTGYWVMNRYWQVTPTTEPTANVGVRFYYNAQDLADVNGSYPTHNLTNQQLIFYKGVGGSADPTTNLEGATAIISILPSTYASDTTWTYHELTDTTSYAEFSVASFSGGGGGGTGNDGALPIKLLSFTAIKESGKNLLQWTTGQEVNSSYFSVERSGDGVNFTSIGQVGAAGNSSVAKNYSLVDAKPVNGMNYYRLKMMDKDGEFSYSEIRTINEAVSFGVSIYPNPVQNILNLNFSSDKAETVQVEVVDNVGKVVATQEVEVAAGVSTQGINVGGLSGGEYYVRVVTVDGENELKFMKE